LSLSLTISAFYVGMDILRRQLSLEPANSPAVAALASCIKDFGAIDEATQLYELALSLTPCKPSYVLNLIHLLEVGGLYNKIGC
jgi:Flp pilus assembly protein TadD